MKGSSEKRAGNGTGVALHLLLLGTLLGAATLLYVRGVAFGLPFFYHWDEPSLVRIGARVVQDGEFNPHFFWYPTLPGYFQAGIYATAYLATVSDAPEYFRIQDAPLSTFYLWGRSANVGLAVLTVLLVYLLTARMAVDRRAGLAAALLLVAMPGFASEVRYITPNTMSAMFGIAAMLPLVGGVGWGAIVGSGFLAGLAIGSKYNLAILLIPMMLRVVLDRSAPGRRLARCALLFVVAIVGFLASTPFALFELPKFLNDVAFVSQHYRVEGHVGAQGEHNLVYFLRHLWSTGIGPPVLLLCGAGLARRLASRNGVASAVCLFPVVYLLLMSRFRVNFVRNLQPVYPFLAVAGGWLLFDLWRHASQAAQPRRWRGIVILAAGLSLALPLKTIWKQGTYLRKTDSRTLAREWVLSHAPAGGKIYLETARAEPHPYGGWAKAPPIPEDSYQVVPIKDLCMNLEPRDLWLRPSELVVLCLNRAHYEGYYGEPGAKAQDRWAKLKPIAQFGGPERPGPEIVVLDPFDPVTAQRLLGRNRGRLELSDGSLRPFLGSGWESKTHTLDGRTYRWSRGDEPELLIPLQETAPLSLQLSLFWEPTADSDSHELQASLNEFSEHRVTIEGANRWVTASLTFEPSETTRGVNRVALHLPGSAARLAVSALTVQPN